MTKHPLELRVPPLALLLVFGAAMWAITQVVPSWHATRAVRLWVAIPLGLAGLLIVLAGVLEFRRARTTVHPQKPEASSSIVRSGIYRYSRNPMYLGFALILAAWALALASPLALLGVLIFVLYMNRFQIAPEERALEALFGEAFDRYRARVRRWL